MGGGGVDAPSKPPRRKCSRISSPPFDDEVLVIEGSSVVASSTQPVTLDYGGGGGGAGMFTSQSMPPMPQGQSTIMPQMSGLGDNSGGGSGGGVDHNGGDGFGGALSHINEQIPMREIQLNGDVSDEDLYRGFSLKEFIVIFLIGFIFKVSF